MKVEISGMLAVYTENCECDVLSEFDLNLSSLCTLWIILECLAEEFETPSRKSP